MGDKSPKSKERDKKQEIARKAQKASAATAKALLSTATPRVKPGK